MIYYLQLSKFKGVVTHKIIVAILMFVFSLLFTPVVYAQNNIRIRTNPKDALTKREFPENEYHVQVELFNANDTTFIKKSDGLYINIPKTKARYFLRYSIRDVLEVINNGPLVSKVLSDEETDDYEELWQLLDTDSIPNSVTVFDMPPVYIQRHYQKKLDEVTVTASRIMFYHRGDTLIYNASAFVLAEGSMLDALIKQLPGTSIDGKGVITCNGRKIDNLLLNGKDLFNGNHELMLENLPAYTVKNIQVYDKQGKTSELMGMDAGDSKHVMDVKLKRQYSHGFMSNVEAGYGTRDRYLGRLFGMWFTENASMTVHAGINNLNDRAEPGQNDPWWNRDLTAEGVSENKFGGITYNINNSANTFEIKGDVKVKHSSAFKDLEVNEVRILPDHDSYNYRWSQSKDKLFDISTGHNLQARIGKRVNLEVKPEFSYRKNEETGSTLSAIFNEEVQDLSRSRIEAIYSGSEKVLADMIVNRDKYDILTTGHSIYGNSILSSDIKLTSKKILKLWIDGDYSDRVNDRYNIQNINYNDDPNPLYSFNRYFKNHPNWDKSLGGGTQFRHFFNTWIGSLSMEYAFKYGENYRTSFLYNLHELDGYDGTNINMSFLPSQLEYERVFSSANSYWSRTSTDEHKFMLGVWNISHYINFLKTGISGLIKIPVNILNRKYHYVGRGVDETINKTQLVNSISGDFMISLPKGVKWIFNPSYSIMATNMQNLISAADATNPLYVSLGNPALKQQSQMSFYNTIIFNRNKWFNNINFSFVKIYDAVTQASIYNPVTGGYTFSPCNINGNYRLAGDYRTDRVFGHDNIFNFAAKTGVSFDHNVDIAGISDSKNDFSKIIPTSTVKIVTASEGVKLSWNTGYHRISISDDFDVRNYNSAWSKFTSWTNNLGASFVLNLPRNWGLSSDISMYTRRGFTDDRLNTTDVVWNARITKSILGGSILFIADAYDLLHQLSNITYTINAQARTETVSNVIPSYMLFRIQYKFNKRPGR